jgi:hypothetical protein
MALKTMGAENIGDLLHSVFTRGMSNAYITDAWNGNIIN